MKDSLDLRHNRDASRFEAWVGDDLAGFVDYTEGAGVTILPHTEVDPAFGGRGIGSALVKFALDELRSAGSQVDPRCPFVARWIERHPEYQDMTRKS